MPAKRKRKGNPTRVSHRCEVSAGGLISRHNADGSVSVVLVKPAGRTTWVLPKGHLEAGETIVGAAMREAREETGLEVQVIEPLGDTSYVYSWRDRPRGPITRISKRVHFFLMKSVGGDTNQHDGEIDQVLWLSLDEALRRASHRGERELIAKARESLLA